MRTPPKLATRLLESCGPDNPALAGDLREAYVSRALEGWYWRQVISAIVLAHDHSAVVRGVAIGWTTLVAFRFVTGSLNREVMDTQLLDWLIAHLGSHPFVMMYAVALWWRPMECLGYLVSGWVVGRSSPSRRGLAVFTFMVTVLVQSTWWTTQWFQTQARAYDNVSYPGLMGGLAALPLVILMFSTPVRQK